MAAGSASAGDRRVLVSALALLGGVTGITFGRVFTGTHPAVRLAIAGVLSVAIAAALSRRHLALSLAASAAGLLFALGVLVFPTTTWLGLPGPATLAAIADALGIVTDRAATEVAPAPPLDSLMTASMMAVWSASTAAHALAVRSGSALLPILPAAALLAFAGVVTEEPPRPGYVVMFLGASYLILFGESMRRASAWGAASRRTRAALSGRWARAIAAVATLAALAVPGVLPGFADEALLDLEPGSGRVGVSPIVDIRPSLLQNPVADLFSVRASRPAYWRLAVLDEFDGRLWTPGETQEGGIHPLGQGFHRLATPVSPHQRTLEQEIEIHELASPWLPAAADPVAVSLEEDLGAAHDIRTGTLELDSVTSDGLRYLTTSSQAWPSVRTLEELAPTSPVGGPLYTVLPPGMPDRIRQIAIDVAGRADSPFRAALAIQNYLRSFTYDENAPAGHGVNDMVHFLTTSRRGYCEQFAAAMAVMARSLGMPARVSIGFLPGDLDETGRYRVTTAQAHAWPELHFGEYGWLPFEPTPGRSNPSAGYLLPTSLRGRDDRGPVRGGAQHPGSLSAAQQRESFQAVGPRLPATQGRGDEGGISGRGALLLVAAVGLALLLMAVPARALWRRLVLRGTRGARHRVLEAYAWLLDGAARLRLGRRRSETPLEYVSRLGVERDVSTEALGRIASLAQQALYSAREPAREQGEEAVAATREVLRQLRRGAGPVRAAAGALRSGRARP